MSEPVVLLVGANGQLGFELYRSLQPLGQVIATTREGLPGTEPLDLARTEMIDTLVEQLRPTFIVNAAAYTAVDAAEEEPETARLINAVAPGRLAEAAAGCGALMVHFSTDYVFDGSARRPYTEDDEPRPVNAYGKSKLEGERAVTAAGGACLVLRTSWLYGARGRNFLCTMLGLGARRETVQVVDDQVGSPTSVRCLAAATAQILAQARANDREWLSARLGLYHLSASGACTWAEFAAAIFADSQWLAPTHTRVAPISSAQFGARAARPGYSVLSNERVLRRFGLRLPEWRTQLRLVLAECTPHEGGA